MACSSRQYLPVGEGTQPYFEVLVRLRIHLFPRLSSSRRAPSSILKTGCAFPSIRLLNTTTDWPLPCRTTQEQHPQQIRRAVPHPVEVAARPHSYTCWITYASLRSHPGQLSRMTECNARLGVQSHAPEKTFDTASSKTSRRQIDGSRRYLQQTFVLMTSSLRE